MTTQAPVKRPLGRRRQELVTLAGPSTRFDYVVALAGNPNTGKSTVFNALTGLRQHTGNWPGKTVARAEGVFVTRGQADQAGRPAGDLLAAGRRAPTKRSPGISSSSASPM